MRFFTFLVIALLTLSNHPAMAVEINEEGAKRLESQINEFINFQKSKALISNNEIVIKGDISVEQADTYYAATLPTILVKRPLGNTVKIGLTAINAIPTENPDEWKMSLAIPSPILTIAQDGRTVKRLDIASQRIGGLWNSKIHNFKKISANFEKIQYQILYNNEIIAADKISITSSISENENKKWSGTQNFNFDAISVKNKVKDYSAEIGSAQITTGFKDTTLPFKSSVIDEKKSQMGFPFNMFDNISSNLEYSIQMNDVDSKDVNLPLTFSDFFKAEKVLLSGEFSDLNNENVNNNVKIEIEGYEQPADTATKKILIPRKINVNLNILNIPVNYIVKNLYNLFELRLNPTAQQITALQAMVELPQKLAEAGTKIEVKDTTVINKDYSMDISGQINADKASLLGATGNAVIAIEGVDNVISEMEKQGSPEKTIMKAKALRETCKTNDESKRNVCNVTLNNQAQLVVNGQNMSTLMDVLLK